MNRGPASRRAQFNKQWEAGISDRTGGFWVCRGQVLQVGPAGLQGPTWLEVARIHRNYTKKDLHDPDNHDGVTTDLEPDILECEVKWP